MTRTLVLALLAVALVPGCSRLSKEDRIADRLEQAGLKPRLARCMAGKLSRDLSDDELRSVAAALREPGADGARPGRKEIVRRIDALGDPHIAETVSRAGIGCTILG